MTRGKVVRIVGPVGGDRRSDLRTVTGKNRLRLCAQRRSPNEDIITVFIAPEGQKTDEPALLGSQADRIRKIRQALESSPDLKVLKSE